jgi:hypothetical protein
MHTFITKKWGVIQYEWKKLTPLAKVMLIVAMVVPFGLVIAGGYTVVRKLWR